MTGLRPAGEARHLRGSRLGLLAVVALVLVGVALVDHPVGAGFRAAAWGTLIGTVVVATRPGVKEDRDRWLRWAARSWVFVQLLVVLGVPLLLGYQAEVGRGAAAWLEVVAHPLGLAVFGTYAASHAAPGTRLRNVMLVASQGAAVLALLIGGSVAMEAAGAAALALVPYGLLVWPLGRLSEPLSLNVPFLQEAPVGASWEVDERLPHAMSLLGKVGEHAVTVVIANDPHPGTTEIVWTIKGLGRARRCALYVTISGPARDGAPTVVGDPIIDGVAKAWCKNRPWASALLRGRSDLLLPILTIPGAFLEEDRIVLTLPGVAPTEAAPWSSSPPDPYAPLRDFHRLLETLGRLADALVPEDLPVPEVPALSEPTSEPAVVVGEADAGDVVDPAAVVIGDADHK